MAIAAALAIGTLYPVPALAQRHGHGGPGGVVFVGGYFYDPFWGPYPWWGPGAFAYPYFPIYDERAQVRLEVAPKNAGVYVDGYYAGLVDDFDGMFQSLPLSPGAHDVTIYLEGYRTVHQKLFMSPRKSYKIAYAMNQLGPGETADAPEMAPPVPPPPQGSATGPRTPLPGAPPLPYAAPGVAAMGTAPVASGFGTLALRVQPADADVTIDGERWNVSSPGERLVVQLSAGSHRIAIRKTGYTDFSTDITVRAGESTPLNVSLSSR